MTDESKCRFCDNPKADRSNAQTCGEFPCQQELRKVYNRERYKADPAVRAYQRANAVKHRPTVKMRMKTLLNELIKDPSIGKVGALKTMAHYLYGPDRFQAANRRVKQ